MRYRLGALLSVTLLVTACQDILPPTVHPSPEPAPTVARLRPLSPWGTEDSFSIVFIDFKVMEDGRSYDPRRNLHIATLSGRERKPLTSYGDSEARRGVYEFNVSPDGKRLAFMGASEAGTGLHIMGTDGSAPVRVVEDDSRWFMRGLSWSPDSRKIVFLQYQGNPSVVIGRSPQVVVAINADGSGLRVITPRVYSGRPLWLPDSMHVAYTAGSPLGMPFPPPTYVVSVDGGEPRLLHDELLLLSWSPDGQKMLWHDRRRLSKSLPSSGATNRSMLWVSGPEGADMRPLTVEEDWVGNPAWGPDSRSVAYTVPVPVPALTLDHYSRQLWAVDVESGERRLVATFPWRDLEKLEWTRDGKAIYVLVRREFEYVYDLWAVPSAGGKPMKIIDGVYDFRLIPGNPSLGVWVPAHSIERSDANAVRESL